MGRLPHPRKLVLFATLSLADLALTRFLLERAGGSAYESNPVAAWWLSSFGWPGLAGFKLAVILLAAALAVIVSRRRPRAGGRVLAFGCSALLAVVLYSGALAGGAGAGDDEPTEADLRQGAELDGVSQAVRRRLAERERLAGDVIAGRLTLLEAAARFRDLDEQNPGFDWGIFRSTYAGASDDERLCRQVLAFVESEPGGTAVLGRLEAELQGRLGRGDLYLPETSAADPAGPPPRGGPCL